MKLRSIFCIMACLSVLSVSFTTPAMALAVAAKDGNVTGCLKKDDSDPFATTALRVKSLKTPANSIKAVSEDNNCSCTCSYGSGPVKKSCSVSVTTSKSCGDYAAGKPACSCP